VRVNASIGLIVKWNYSLFAIEAKSLVEEAEHLEFLLGAHAGSAGLVGCVGSCNDRQGSFDGRWRLGSNGKVSALGLEPVFVGDEGQLDLVTFRRRVGPRASGRRSGLFSDLFLGSFLLTFHAVGRFEPVIFIWFLVWLVTTITDIRKWIQSIILANGKLTWICNCRPNWVLRSRTWWFQLAVWPHPAAWRPLRRWELLKQIPGHIFRSEAHTRMNKNEEKNQVKMCVYVIQSNKYFGEDLPTFIVRMLEVMCDAGLYSAWRFIHSRKCGQALLRCLRELLPA